MEIKLPTFEKRSIHPAVIKQCRQIFFRQSMVKDYLECPQMALYRWILNFDQAAPFFSATMGTAGHHVIYTIHQARKYDYGYDELSALLEEGFNRELQKSPLYPELPTGCETPEEGFALKSPEYVKLLLAYQNHPRNKEFHSTLHEQAFVLRIPPTNEGDAEYLITGQIDQGGYYDDGMFALRDYKFRDNQFKPSKTVLDLDIQATVYCTAIRYGVPACESCKPRYEEDFLEGNTLVYNGPCETCAAKVGTPAWPQKFAQLFEMIWMKDFDVHTKDQHDEWIIDPQAQAEGRKIKNPKGKGPPVYPRIRNPDYDTGYKKGQMKGIGFLQTVRPPSSMQVYMSDILRVCDEIRKGSFFRNPGDACNFLCKHRESCVKGLELEVQDVNLANISAIGTDDPW